MHLDRLSCIRKQRLSREEQITDAVDVFSDFTGNRVLLNEDANAGTVVGKRKQGNVHQGLRRVGLGREGRQGAVYGGV